MQSRAPGLYLLDERTRLAGCHMIRDAVERLVLEEGVPTVQAVHARGDRGRPPRLQVTASRGLLVPGRYRSAGFTEARYANKTNLPKRARRDLIIHGAYEAVVDRDGRWTTDLRGSSAWGWHSFNATPAAQQGMQWILFTQTLICNDKINDGAYYATELLLTEGSWADLGDAPCSSSFPWMPMFSHLDRLPAGDLARAAVARLHRGDRLHLHRAGQRRPGRRHRPVRADLRLHELRDRRPGPGRQVRARRARLRRRRVQPRGRHGRHRDVGAGQADDLPRPPDQAQHRRLGRHRGGSSFETLLLVNGTQTSRSRTSARAGCSPRRASSAATRRRAPTSTTSSAPTSSSRPPRGEAYPVGDVSGEEPALNALRRRAPARAGPLHDDDRGQDRRPLPLHRTRRRRPRRPAAALATSAIEEDIAGGHMQRRWAERAYGRGDREGLMHAAPRARAARRASGGPSSASASSPGPDRAGEGDVRRVDAAGAGLGGGVPRLLGPARGLRLRRRHADRAGPEGRAGQGHAARSRCASSLPAPRSSCPDDAVRGPDHHRHDEGDCSATCSTRSSRAAR